MTNAPIQIRTDDLEAVIGRKVRNLMLDYGLKAADVARLTGLEATGLSRRLAGKRGWEPDDLAVVSYVFNVSVAYLFGEIDRIAPLPAAKRAQMGAKFPWATQLPDLDSNQEPIGSTPDEGGQLVNLADYQREVVTRKRGRASGAAS